MVAMPKMQNDISHICVTLPMEAKLTQIFHHLISQGMGDRMNHCRKQELWIPQTTEIASFKLWTQQQPQPP